MKAKCDTLGLSLIIFLLIDLNVNILAKKMSTHKLSKNHAHKKFKSEINKKTGFIPHPELMEVSRVCMKGNDMSHRIISGGPASQEKFPWTAAVFIKIKGIFELWCAGSIISKNHILTAAHCFFRSGDSSLPYTNNTEDIFVRLGDFNVVSPHDDLKRDVINRQVIDFWTHEDFGNPYNFDNDIALLRLNESLTFENKYIQPVCVSNLNAPRQPLRYGKVLGVVGWGKTKPYGAASPILKFIAVHVINLKICERVLKARRSSKRNICLGNLNGRPQRLCQGDSGGPFLPYPDGKLIPIVVGIVSFGPTNCNHPSMMTNVASYYDWINYRVGLKNTFNSKE